jgi:hypothetical protein
MNVRYRVELGQTERAELTALVSGGKHAARKLKRAQILLAADAGARDEEIARGVGVGGCPDGPRNPGRRGGRGNPAVRSAGVEIALVPTFIET